MITSVRSKRVRGALVACILVFFAMAGCSKGSSPTSSNNDLTDTQTLALGWQNFEAGKYDAAVTNFTSVNIQSSSTAVRGEALCGRGWASMNLRNLAGAKSDFAIASGLAGISSGVLDDIRVGQAFALYALNDFPGAASSGTAALSDKPSYSFTHDAKVTAKRVRLLVAQSYYASGQFALAAGQLDILDPTHAPHSSDPSILLASIMSQVNSL
jgi:hypothetical protein